jgi:hypothetical protein
MAKSYHTEGFFVRCHFQNYLKMTAYPASVREMLSRINSDPIQQRRVRVSGPGVAKVEKLAK